MPNDVKRSRVKWKAVQVRLSAPQYELLRMCADEHDQSMGGEVRQALKRYFREIKLGAGPDQGVNDR